MCNRRKGRDQEGSDHFFSLLHRWMILRSTKQHLVLLSVHPDNSFTEKGEFQLCVQARQNFKSN